MPVVVVKYLCVYRMGYISAYNVTGRFLGLKPYWYLYACTVPSLRLVPIALFSYCCFFYACNVTERFLRDFYVNNNNNR